MRPGEIEIAYLGSEPATVTVNLDSLLGWEVAAGPATIVDGPLVSARITSRGRVVLRYRPFYWPWILWVFAPAIAALGALRFMVLRKRVETPHDGL